MHYTYVNWKKKADIW